jgi:hypothetical protein
MPIKGKNVTISNVARRGGSSWSVEKARAALIKKIDLRIAGDLAKSKSGVKVKGEDGDVQITLMANGLRVGGFVDIENETIEEALNTTKSSIANGDLDQELIDNHKKAQKRRKS